MAPSKASGESEKAFLPLTPAVFHILLALAPQPRHGYGISQEVLRQSDGTFRMGPGTLYGTIQRLLEQGLVDESPNPRREDVDPRRRYYRITELGRRALAAEVQRMNALVRRAFGEGIVPRPSER